MNKDLENQIVLFAEKYNHEVGKSDHQQRRYPE